MNQPDERRLTFEGAVNFRDLGGYAVAGGRRTRWRRLFRSDSLADLTEADQARLTALGLHALIDFRLPSERQRKPNRLPVGATLRTVEIGFVPQGTLGMLRQVLAGTIDPTSIEREVVSHYRCFPVDHHAEYRAMLAQIEEAEGRPVLIHCTSGKDRTGYSAAVILMALGASRAVILEDYALTNSYRRDIRHLLAPDAPPAVLTTLTAALPKYLQAAFETIDSTYGSDEAYLAQGLGLDEARRQRLIDLLTEVPAPV